MITRGALALFLIAGCSEAPIVSDPAAVEALLPVSLTFVSDGDGKTDDQRTYRLMFEPGGVVDYYVFDADSPKGHTGTFAYDGHTLAMKFKDPDFHPDVRAAFAAGAKQVNLPFGVLGASSSKWSAGYADLLEDLHVIFGAALLGDQIDPEAAIDRAVAYGNAVIQSANKSDAPAVVVTSTISISHSAEMEIEICYQVGGCLPLHLSEFTVLGDPSPAEVQSSIADIGNSELGVVGGLPFRDTNSDPLEKWALLIVPFKSEISDRVTYHANRYTLVASGWDDGLKGITAKKGGLPLGYPADYPAGGYGYDYIEQKIGENHYQTLQLADGQANVAGIVSAILDPHHAHSPGVILFDSHGYSDGRLLTADLLNHLIVDGDPNSKVIDRDWQTAFGKFLDSLATAFPDHPDWELELSARDPNYPDDPYRSPYFYTGSSFSVSKPIDVGVYAVGLRPAFWQWLRSKGADFSRSLVYIGGCATTATDNLKDAIGAAAHFGMDQNTTPDSTLIFFYMVQNLFRHAHSAEEAYYNALRVLRTRGAIYPEDWYLDVFQNKGCAPAGTAQEDDPCIIGTREFLASSFRGYAADPGSPGVDLLTLGWLTDPSPGNIWWLLFKSRFYTATTQAKALSDCWDAWWMNMDPGSTTTGAVCNDMAPGVAPSVDEVGYATWLDHKAFDAVPQGMLTPAPRWTWNDSP
jgi:hypothetical protein